MSLRIATVQAEIEAAYQALTTMTLAERLRLQETLATVEQNMRIYRPNVVAMHRMWMHVARFSIQIVQRNMQVIRSYLPLPSPTAIADENEPSSPTAAEETEPAYPPYEFTTALLTYTIRAPNQGYLHDKTTIGPEYTRFATKDSLSDLAALIKAQRAKVTSPSPPNPLPQQCWSRNMK
ncbi:hypothetical protein XPA_008009 [Xanthoria parietina]